MNSLNKHGPTLVFIFGILLLLVSMRSFFHPEMPPPAPASAPRGAPPQPAASAAQQNQVEAVRRDYKPVQLRQVKQMVSGNYADVNAQVFDNWQKAAKDHLKTVHLNMKLPDGMQFHATQEGAIKILMGAGRPDKVGFYLFTADGKFPFDKAQQALKDYFQGEMALKTNGQGSSYDNRGGFQDGTLIKGNTDKGDEFQSYFFRDPSSNKTHMVMLIDKDLGKHPAQVRQIFDSIHSSR
jgi:hypothetical protein